MLNALFVWRLRNPYEFTLRDTRAGQVAKRVGAEQDGEPQVGRMDRSTPEISIT
jgi:hypothetical protein